LSSRSISAGNQNINHGHDMANYDTPGLTYDSGVVYDDQFVPQPRNKIMAKVKQNMKGL
jgi:hypothetical protein